MTTPSLVATDRRGHLIVHPFYRMAIFDGREVRPPREDELAPLPPGSDLWRMPGRLPVGINPETGGPETVGGLEAVAGFASPAWLRLALPAYVREPDAPVLPLFAYAPLGWRNGRLVTTAVRVDRSNRQDPRRFRMPEIAAACRALRRRMPRNRLVEHLEHCARVHGCRAAQNFFLAREECPLPTSPTCNSGCAGCLSLDPAGDVPAPHQRISFVPDPEEIAEVALLHIARVPRPVVSFGQGCEGEPLLVAPVLAEAIRQIRARTRAGTIHLNTNGSRPRAVAELCAAGLDSIRLSVNSFQSWAYDAYFAPRGYGLEDVLESGRVVAESGGFVSVNLLTFPGVTDAEADVEATLRGLPECRADLVQMRNLNIDPDIYRDRLGPGDLGPLLGLRAAMARMRGARAGLRFGYFNPPVRTLVLRRRRKGRNG